MPFIRTKKISGKQYFYLVENKRINGKVRQKVIRYLGKSENILSMISRKSLVSDDYQKSGFLKQHAKGKKVR